MLYLIALTIFSMNKYELAKSFFNSEQEIIYKQFTRFVVTEMLKLPNPNDFTGDNLDKYLLTHGAELFTYTWIDWQENRVFFSEVRNIRNSPEKNAFYEILVEFLHYCGDTGISPQDTEGNENLKKFLEIKISETTV